MSNVGSDVPFRNLHGSKHRSEHDGAVAALREGEYNTWGVRGGALAQEKKNKTVIEAQVEAAAMLPGPGEYGSSLEKSSLRKPVSFTVANTGRGEQPMSDFEEGALRDPGSTLSQKSMSISQSHSSRNWREWTPPDVQRWLQRIGLKHLIPQFAESKVSGTDLEELRAQDLQGTMPIQALHDRQRLIRELNALRGQYSITAVQGTANIGPGKYNVATKGIQEMTRRRTEVGGRFNKGKPTPLEADLKLMEGPEKPGPGQYRFVTERHIHFMQSSLGAGIKFTTSKSSATLAHAARGLSDDDSGPGPGSYQLPEPEPDNRAPRFGKTQMKSNLDEVQRRGREIPGPADYSPGTQRFDLGRRAARKADEQRSIMKRRGDVSSNGRHENEAPSKPSAKSAPPGGRDTEPPHASRNSGIVDPEDERDCSPRERVLTDAQSGLHRPGPLPISGRETQADKEMAKTFVVHRKDLPQLLQDLYHTGGQGPGTGDSEEDGGNMNSSELEAAGPGEEWQFTLAEWQTILRRYGLIPHYMSTTESVHVYSAARRSVIGRNQRPRQAHHAEAGEGRLVLQVALRNLAQRLNVPVKGMDMPKLKAQHPQHYGAWHDGTEERDHMGMELRACAQVDAPLVERYLRAVARRERKEEAPSTNRAALGEFNSDWMRGKDEVMRRMREEAEQHTEEVEKTMSSLRKKFATQGVRGWKS